MCEFIHRSVLTREVVEALRPRPGGIYVDGTIGGGGHAAALLQASAPTGKLFGCDRDGTAVRAAQARLAPFAGRFEIRQGSFADLAGWIEPNSCDGVVLDLGVSSPQLDLPERGFSFQSDGPLDMRMDAEEELTAAALLNQAGVEELARIFWEYGGEAHARRMARAIERQRRVEPLRRTRELAELIERVAPRGGRRTHPATKVFQALRIAVNDEMGHLRRGLEAAVEILKPGGRLAAISFHSVEDRVLKKFGGRLSRDYEAGEPDVPELRRPRPPVLRWVERKAIRPGAAEARENPRSRSAQCRVLEKCVEHGPKQKK
ncbi:MAG: 16S rRNA (cytosine(1402)-N(4))-methyltransferase RsmH [Verrucomicrobiota bacterium]